MNKAVLEGLLFVVGEDGLTIDQMTDVLGIDEDGMKKVLTITIGENESAKYWMTVLNELKNRGVQDILVLCADGLTGLKEAISAIYPKTEYQRCIVHQIRNSLKYVPYTDKKELAHDLKTVYQASTEELAYTNLLELDEKWKTKKLSIVILLLSPA